MSQYILKPLLLLTISISCMNCQQILCGETKTGTRDAREEVEFTFTATNSYNEVYLEGCASTHDIWLEIQDSNGQTIADEDDGNDHGSQDQCGHQYAGDITIPHPVQSDDTYTFIIKGYQRRSGYYSVTLVCTESAQTPNPTPAPTPSPNPASIEPVEPSSCSRHREPWHLISDEQRNLYINGFKKLAVDGKLVAFTQTHSSSAEHSNSGFLPWHRYFIWELETQFRSLGGDWECFSLPYWDWSHEVETYGDDIPSWFILNSGLGSTGNANNNYCVEGNFSPNQYNPYNGNCLRRVPCDDCSWTAGSASNMMDVLTDNDNYMVGDDDGYRYNMESVHGSAHILVGGVDDNKGQLGSIDTATDDPIFYLLHSFVDFQYSLWQDCLDYELFDNSEIRSDMYDTSNDREGRTVELDDELDFGELGEQSWADIYGDSVTIRDMHSNEDWDVTYDKGDYFTRANVEDNSVCEGNINSDWFKDITLRRRLKYDGNLNGKEYSQDIFERLHKKVGGKNKTKKQNKELYKTWAEMECQYLTIGNKCERPRYFDDCSDMKKNKYIERNGGYDIDITLDELIEKVADYPCMVKTRQMYYNWAKDMGTLSGLCRGDYDTFCDKEFKKERGKDKCKAKWEHKSSKRYIWNF